MSVDNPQMEDGFVAVANVLFERIFQSNLPSKELCALMHVIRVTYGFRSKIGPIYAYELAEDVDVDERYARRLLETLCDRRILIRVSSARGRRPATYTLNKKWKQWKHERKCDFPDLKDSRRGVAHYPSTEDGGYPTTRQNEANYPSTSTPITPLRALPLPGEKSKVSEQTESRSTPIQKTKNIKHNPPTPASGEGGVEVSDFRSRIRRAMIRNGWTPSRKELTKATDLVASPTPLGWDKTAWRQHVFRSLIALCDTIKAEAQAGATVYAPIALACERLRNQVQMDQMLPPPRKEAI